jgi:2-oxoglutarate dehydrogenase complex dehydrogenase (E1) component-like enzyme
MSTEEAPSLGASIHPEPVSPPPVAVESTVEGEDRKETVEVAEEETVRKTLKGGHDAREMSRQAVEARQRQRADAAPKQTEAEVLRNALTEQVSIATSKAKGTTPAARTAAAKLIPDLQAALRDAEEREASSKRINWDALPPETLSLLMTVIDASPSLVTSMQETAEEWQAAHASAEEEGAAPPPPLSGTPAVR